MIDSISEGLALVRRRPALIALPVLLDLLLWLCPQLSIQPLVQRVVATISAPPAIGDSATYEAARALRTLLLDFGEHANLFSLLSNGFIGVPSISATGLPEGLGHLSGKVVLHSTAAMLALTLILTAAGVVIAAVYLTAIAAAVRQEAMPFWRLVVKAGKNTLRLLSFVAALAGAGLALGLPASFLAFVASLASSQMGTFVLSLVALVAIWAGLWAMIYLFFVVDALILQEVGLGRAIINSILVVRTSFWPAIGLILLLNLLGAGLGTVWRWIASASPGGFFVAVLINSFISTGLAAASLLFYRDRYQRMREQFAPKGG